MKTDELIRVVEGTTGYPAWLQAREHEGLALGNMPKHFDLMDGEHRHFSVELFSAIDEKQTASRGLMLEIANRALELPLPYRLGLLASLDREISRDPNKNRLPSIGDINAQLRERKVDQPVYPSNNIFEYAHQIGEESERLIRAFDKRRPVTIVAAWILSRVKSDGWQDQVTIAKVNKPKDAFKLQHPEVDDKQQVHYKIPTKITTKVEVVEEIVDANSSRREELPARPDLPILVQLVERARILSPEGLYFGEEADARVARTRHRKEVHDRINARRRQEARMTVRPRPRARRYR